MKKNQLETRIEKHKIDIKNPMYVAKDLYP